MRVFTIVGVVLTIIGLGLLVVACSTQPVGPAGMIGGMAAGIAAVTLLPMGIVFTLIGVWTQRLIGGRAAAHRGRIRGQATILSVGGGNVVVNRINVLLTFRLRVALPGRAPYEVQHRQLMSMFAMAALQIGATVPVMVDRTDPNHLTIDVAGEGASSGAGVTTASTAAQRARPVTEFDATESPRQVQPNTLSTMGAIEPNTISTGRADQGTLDPGAFPSPSIPGTPGLDAATAAAIAKQLSRLGITVDPGMIAGGQMTMDGGTLDLRPDTVASVLADGIPGTAFIRGMSDTGVNVRDESLLRLTLDVKGAGGDSYQVEIGSLVPDAARSRALPGATVPVRIDPSQANNVVVDWSGLA